jgi:hypothetical protein
MTGVVVLRVAEREDLLEAGRGQLREERGVEVRQVGRGSGAAVGVDQDDRLALAHARHPAAAHRDKTTALTPYAALICCGV